MREPDEGKARSVLMLPGKLSEIICLNERRPVREVLDEIFRTGL